MLPSGQTGSGIYTTGGVLASWTSSTYPQTRLVMADIPVSPARRKVDWSRSATSLSPLVPIARDVVSQVYFSDIYSTAVVSTSGYHQICQVRLSTVAAGDVVY